MERLSTSSRRVGLDAGFGGKDRSFPHKALFIHVYHMQMGCGWAHGDGIYAHCTPCCEGRVIHFQRLTCLVLFYPQGVLGAEFELSFVGRFLGVLYRKEYRARWDSCCLNLWSQQTWMR